MTDELRQLEAQLRSTGKFWMYGSRVTGKQLADSERIAIAKSVLAAPKSWAQGLAEEFATRQFPAGYDD